MQEHLVDLDAIGLAFAGLLAVVTARRTTAWLLPIQVPLGLALFGIGAIDLVKMIPALVHEQGDSFTQGVMIALAVGSILLGGLFVLQLIARAAPQSTAAALAQMAASSQLLLGLVGLGAPIAYLAIRLHWVAKLDL
jgi:hypothetical protein